MEPKAELNKAELNNQETETVETETLRNRGGRPFNSTTEAIAARAAAVRKHIIVGRTPKEIRSIENLTVGEYQAAVRYIGREWSSNREAFGNFRMGITAHLEQIEDRMKALLASGANEVDIVHAYVKLKKLWIETEQSQYEMALKLGILQREAFKIEDRREVNVRFGDEDTIPFFAQKPVKSLEAAVN